MGLKHGEESDMARWPLIVSSVDRVHEAPCVLGAEHMLRKCLVNNA